MDRPISRNALIVYKSLGRLVSSDQRWVKFTSRIV